MKARRNNFLSLFFLFSFFISFGANVAITSNITFNQLNALTKSHLHIHEKVTKADLNDLLIEENENEDEVDIDLALHFLPFFIELVPHSASITFSKVQPFKLLNAVTPIYIDICNFRI